MNTDAQALLQSRAPNRIQIGKQVTRGLGTHFGAAPCLQPRCVSLWTAPKLAIAGHAGTGGNPELGEAAAEESRDLLLEAVNGADLVRSGTILCSFRCSCTCLTY